MFHRSARWLKLDSGKNKVGSSRSSSEDGTNAEKCTPAAIEPHPGPHDDRTDERVHYKTDTGLGIEVRLFVRIERGTVFEPCSGVNGASEEVRQTSNLVQIPGMPQMSNTLSAIGSRRTRGICSYPDQGCQAAHARRAVSSAMRPSRWIARICCIAGAWSARSLAKIWRSKTVGPVRASRRGPAELNESPFGGEPIEVPGNVRGESDQPPYLHGRR